MAHILVITGVSNSGKTATAHRVYNHLMRNPDFNSYDFYHAVNSPYIGGLSLDNGDFIDILITKNKEDEDIKVGIISQGDYLKNHPNKKQKNSSGDFIFSLVAHIKHLISNGCKIIICCASTGNNNVYQEIKNEFNFNFKEFVKNRITENHNTIYRELSSTDEDDIAKQVINYLMSLL